VTVLKYFCKIEEASCKNPNGNLEIQIQPAEDEENSKNPQVKT